MLPALEMAGWVMSGLSLLVLVPVLLLLLQVLAALLPRAESRSTLASSADPRARVAVLMPAHDEATGILEPLRSVLPQLQARDRVLVVADNCSDDTASVAAAAGAEVVQRQDSVRRGKGYALDFGVRHLQADPPDVVVIVDADCIVAPGSLDLLVRHCHRTGRATQALYRMHAPPRSGLKIRMAEFAWIVKNHVRPLGYARLGLPCQLMGTGMAFPWEQLRSAPLASGHIVEDMQLGLDLATAGHAPQFLLDAGVSSSFPSNAEGLQAQRTRWEHGHLRVIAAAGPRLLARAIATWQPSLAALVLDLCVPPLASLVLGLSGWWVATAAFWFVGGAVWPLVLSSSALSLLGVAVLAAWAGFGRSAVSLWELSTAPLYVLRKIPMYLKLLRKRQVEWVRTKRDDGRA